MTLIIILLYDVFLVDESQQPREITRISRIITVAANYDVALDCTTTGNLVPTIQWTLNKSPILVGGRTTISGGNLKITSQCNMLYLIYYYN